VSILAANMVPVDLRIVAGSSLGGACIILCSFSVSLQAGFIWWCLVSVRCNSVGLVWVLTIFRRCKIVLCMPLASNVLAPMGGCRYVSLACAPCCVFVDCFLCALSVSFSLRFQLI